MQPTQTNNGENLAEHVVQQVRAEMTRQGISQETLGARIGWDQRRVSRRLTGEVAIDFTELQAIAGALGVPATQLMSAA